MFEGRQADKGQLTTCTRVPFRLLSIWIPLVAYVVAIATLMIRLVQFDASHEWLTFVSVLSVLGATFLRSCVPRLCSEVGRLTFIDPYKISQEFLPSAEQTPKGVAFLCVCVVDHVLLPFALVSLPGLLLDNSVVSAVISLTSLRPSGGALIALFWTHVALVGFGLGLGGVCVLAMVATANPYDESGTSKRTLATGVVCAFFVVAPLSVGTCATFFPCRNGGTQLLYAPPLSCDTSQAAWYAAAASAALWLLIVPTYQMGVDWLQLLEDRTATTYRRDAPLLHPLMLQVTLVARLVKLVAVPLLANFGGTVVALALVGCLDGTLAVWSLFGCLSSVANAQYLLARLLPAQFILTVATLALALWKSSVSTFSEHDLATCWWVAYSVLVVAPLTWYAVRFRCKFTQPVRLGYNDIVSEGVFQGEPHILV